MCIKFDDTRYFPVLSATLSGHLVTNQSILSASRQCLNIM